MAHHVKDSFDEARQKRTEDFIKGKPPAEPVDIGELPECLKRKKKEDALK
jgi:hypothetical protein